MLLLSLLPVLGINIPAPLLSVGLKVAGTEGVFKDGGVDFERVAQVLPGIVKDDEDVTKALVAVGLKGLGVASAAADLAVEYAFATDGERTDEETQAFAAQFKFLNSPLGRIGLPLGCKECGRIHYEYQELNQNASGDVTCKRCGREIPLSRA